MNKKPTVYCCKNHSEIGSVTAALIADAIKKNPNLVLGLPTGQTPVPVYQELCKMYKAGELDCSGVTTFNLDEYFHRGKGDPDSYYTFMHEQLFDHVPFKASYFPDSSGELATEIDKNCKQYDALIESVGGIDLQILGIGSNGHIGFNEPSSTWSEGTAFVKLTPQTVSDNAKKFYNGNELLVPKTAISMGTNQIMRAKSIILIASGEDKAKAISDTIDGIVTPRVPASKLQNHDDVTFIIDEDAAKFLD